MECGDGILTRTIECHRVADDKPVNETFCIHNISTAKPKTLKSCKVSRCTGEWGVEEWGKVYKLLGITLTHNYLPASIV